MKRLISLLIVGALFWYGYSKYQERVAVASAPVASKAVTAIPDSAPYRCDGRALCSQMTSCAEATYFLKNCPNTQMDGNNDGVPCERQWCNK